MNDLNVIGRCASSFDFVAVVFCSFLYITLLVLHIHIRKRTHTRGVCVCERVRAITLQTAYTRFSYLFICTFSGCACALGVAKDLGVKHLIDEIRYKSKQEHEIDLFSYKNNVHLSL